MNYLQKTNIYNKERSENKYLPASTFKIVNTLIALQEKIVKDENEIIKWNGKDYGMAVWNKDQNMKTAFATSCVWFYQELSKKIGNDIYLKYLKNINYGNEKTGPIVESFWLEGDLRITAVEQIELLRKIYNKELIYLGKNHDKKHQHKNETIIVSIYVCNNSSCSRIHIRSL